MAPLIDKFDDEGFDYRLAAFESFIKTLQKDNYPNVEHNLVTYTGRPVENVPDGMLTGDDIGNGMVLYFNHAIKIEDKTAVVNKWRELFL